jgi:hypothetical protein
LQCLYGVLYCVYVWCSVVVRIHVLLRLNTHTLHCNHSHCTNHTHTQSSTSMCPTTRPPTCTEWGEQAGEYVCVCVYIYICVCVRVWIVCTFTHLTACVSVCMDGARVCCSSWLNRLCTNMHTQTLSCTHALRFGTLGVAVTLTESTPSNKSGVHKLGRYE